MAKRLIAFSWYGGKFSHLNFLLPLLPNDCRHYCEPYGGSGAVLLNREPAPIETYNDIDGEAVNFFKVLREQTDELLRQLQLTPYSRLEFERAITEPTEKLCELERARRFFVRARQVRSGLADMHKTGYSSLHYWSWKRKPSLVVSGNWRSAGVLPGEILENMQNGKSETRGSWNWNPEPGSARIRIFEKQEPMLMRVAQRLLRVQLECLPAQEVIQKYDSPGTLFYVDPPYTWLGAYVENSDAWKTIKLAEQLRRVQGRVAISGYSTEFHENLYQGWRRALGPVKTKPAGRGVGGKDGQKTREALWMNYDEEGHKFT